MKFQFEKLGAINKAELELGDLTIICGDNNTGKTYVSYAIYWLLAAWNNLDFKLSQEEIGDLLENGILKIDLKQFENNTLEQINKLSEHWTQSIPMMFSANEGYFSETSCEVLIDYKPSYNNELQFSAQSKEKEILKAVKERSSAILEITLLVENEALIPSTPIVKDFIVKALGKALLGHYFDFPFIITAERIGISLFYRELDISKNVLVEQLQKQSRKFELKENEYLIQFRNTHVFVKFINALLEEYYNLTATFEVKYVLFDQMQQNRLNKTETKSNKIEPETIFTNNKNMPFIRFIILVNKNFSI